ncbi:unnamed protein product [Amoebophrya sp. A120]|nr:unnamed protein product [Amoebophrya sp. A120]|eukprot:GSA120T00021009001.1
MQDTLVRIVNNLIACKDDRSAGARAVVGGSTTSSTSRAKLLTCSSPGYERTTYNLTPKRAYSATRMKLATPSNRGNLNEPIGMHRPERNGPDDAASLAAMTQTGREPGCGVGGSTTSSTSIAKLLPCSSPAPGEQREQQTRPTRQLVHLPGGGPKEKDKAQDGRPRPVTPRHGDDSSTTAPDGVNQNRLEDVHQNKNLEFLYILESLLSRMGYLESLIKQVESLKQSLAPQESKFLHLSQELEHRIKDYEKKIGGLYFAGQQQVVASSSALLRSSSTGGTAVGGEQDKTGNLKNKMNASGSGEQSYSSASAGAGGGAHATRSATGAGAAGADSHAASATTPSLEQLQKAFDLQQVNPGATQLLDTIVCNSKLLDTSASLDFAASSRFEEMLVHQQANLNCDVQEHSKCGTTSRSRSCHFKDLETPFLSCVPYHLNLSYHQDCAVPNWIEAEFQRKFQHLETTAAGGYCNFGETDEQRHDPVAVPAAGTVLGAASSWSTTSLQQNQNCGRALFPLRGQQDPAAKPSAELRSRFFLDRHAVPMDIEDPLQARSTCSEQRTTQPPKSHEMMMMNKAVDEHDHEVEVLQGSSGSPTKRRMQNREKAQKLQPEQAHEEELPSGRTSISADGVIVESRNGKNAAPQGDDDSTRQDCSGAAPSSSRVDDPDAGAAGTTHHQPQLISESLPASSLPASATRKNNSLLKPQYQSIMDHLALSLNCTYRDQSFEKAHQVRDVHKILKQWSGDAQARFLFREVARFGGILEEAGVLSCAGEEFVREVEQRSGGCARTGFHEDHASDGTRTGEPFATVGNNSRAREGGVGVPTRDSTSATSVEVGRPAQQQHGGPTPPAVMSSCPALGNSYSSNRNQPGAASLFHSLNLNRTAFSRRNIGWSKFLAHRKKAAKSNDENNKQGNNDELNCGAKIESDSAENKAAPEFQFTDDEDHDGHDDSSSSAAQQEDHYPTMPRRPPFIVKVNTNTLSAKSAESVRMQAYFDEYEAEFEKYCAEVVEIGRTVYGHKPEPSFVLTKFFPEAKKPTGERSTAETRGGDKRGEEQGGKSPGGPPGGGAAGAEPRNHEDKTKSNPDGRGRTAQQQSPSSRARAGTAVGVKKNPVSDGRPGPLGAGAGRDTTTGTSTASVLHLQRGSSTTSRGAPVPPALESSRTPANTDCTAREDDSKKKNQNVSSSTVHPAGAGAPTAAQSLDEITADDCDLLYDDLLTDQDKKQATAARAAKVNAAAAAASSKSKTKKIVVPGSKAARAQPPNEEGAVNYSRTTGGGSGIGGGEGTTTSIWDQQAAPAASQEINKPLFEGLLSGHQSTTTCFGSTSSTSLQPSSSLVISASTSTWSSSPTSRAAALRKENRIMPPPPPAFARGGGGGRFYQESARRTSRSRAFAPPPLPGTTTMGGSSSSTRDRSGSNYAFGRTASRTTPTAVASTLPADRARGGGTNIAQHPWDNLKDHSTSSRTGGALRLPHPTAPSGSSSSGWANLGRSTSTTAAAASSTTSRSVVAQPGSSSRTTFLPMPADLEILAGAAPPVLHRDHAADHQAVNVAPLSSGVVGRGRPEVSAVAVVPAAQPASTGGGTSGMITRNNPTTKGKGKKQGKNATAATSARTGRIGLDEWFNNGEKTESEPDTECSELPDPE